MFRGCPSVKGPVPQPVLMMFGPMRPDFRFVKSGVGRSLGPDQGHEQAFHGRQNEQTDCNAYETQNRNELPIRAGRIPKE